MEVANQIFFSFEYFLNYALPRLDEVITIGGVFTMRLVGCTFFICRGRAQGWGDDAESWGTVVISILLPPPGQFNL